MRCLPSDSGLVCMGTRPSVVSFPRESYFSPIFCAFMTTFIIHPSTVVSQKQPQATNQKRFRFAMRVWLLFWGFSNYPGVVCISSFSSKYSAWLAYKIMRQPLQVAHVLSHVCGLPLGFRDVLCCCVKSTGRGLPTKTQS